MPDFDTDAAAALDQDVIRPAFFVYLDIDTYPVRVTTFGASVTFSGTGDTDLDGETFSAIDPTVIDVGDVVNREGGSETLTVTLSGILEFDSETMNLIGDTANWRGQVARLWMRLHDPDGSEIGAIVPYYTGRMVAVDFLPSPETQTIELRIENYLAALNQASNRTYLSQKDYDSGDLSAQATIGAANGASTGPGALAGVIAGGGRGNTRVGFGLTDRF